MEYRTGPHTKYKIEYHFVWITKYRYHVLQGELGLRVRELVKQTCSINEIEILRGVVSKDHIHILVLGIFRKIKMYSKIVDKAKFIFITIIFILSAHYLAVFPHEYAHSLMASILGYKNNFLDINFGVKNILNVLLLYNIDENVDYTYILAHGVKWHAALIGFAGPWLANGIMYIITLVLLNNKNLMGKKHIFYFLFWFNFMNLANFYDYIPIRTFANHGDIFHITSGLGISPYFVYVIFGYMVAFLIWYFYTNTMIKAFIHLKLNTVTAKASLMILCVILLFAYFGMPGFFNYGEISYFLSATSIIVIPGVIIACWPTRNWVKRKIELIKKQ